MLHKRLTAPMSNFKAGQVQVLGLWAGLNILTVTVLFLLWLHGAIICVTMMSRPMWFLQVRKDYCKVRALWRQYGALLCIDRVYSWKSVYIYLQRTCIQCYLFFIRTAHAEDVSVYNSQYAWNKFCFMLSANLHVCALSLVNHGTGVFHFKQKSIWTCDLC